MPQVSGILIAWQKYIEQDARLHQFLPFPDHRTPHPDAPTQEEREKISGDAALNFAKFAEIYYDQTQQREFERAPEYVANEERPKRRRMASRVRKSFGTEGLDQFQQRRQLPKEVRDLAISNWRLVDRLNKLNNKFSRPARPSSKVRKARQAIHKLKQEAQKEKRQHH